VYELYPDGAEFDTGRTFTIRTEDGDYTIVTAMFNALYRFTIGPNGFRIIWDNDENGNPLRMISGQLNWVGPRPPAAPIGGMWWRIKRIV